MRTRLLGLALVLLAGCGMATDQPPTALPPLESTVVTSEPLESYIVATTPPPTTAAQRPPTTRASRGRPGGSGTQATQPPASTSVAPAGGEQVDVDGMPAQLRRIGGCESSGRPDGPLQWTIVNRSGSSASGAFQILDGTWRSWRSAYGSDVGAPAYARAKDAPPNVQVTVATRAYQRQGTRPWSASRRCWA